jgi:hypothetical protein
MFKDLLQKALAWFFGILLTLLVIVGVIYSIWHFGMKRVPPDVARLWAMLATAMLPVTAVLFWWFGNTEARGRMKGIDDAVDKMMGTAIKAANAQSQPQPQQPAHIIREVQIHEPRRRLSPDDVIEI